MICFFRLTSDLNTVLQLSKEHLYGLSSEWLWKIKLYWNYNCTSIMLHWCLICTQYTGPRLIRPQNERKNLRLHIRNISFNFHVLSGKIGPIKRDVQLSRGWIMRGPLYSRLRLIETQNVQNLYFNYLNVPIVQW